MLSQALQGDSDEWFEIHRPKHCPFFYFWQIIAFSKVIYLENIVIQTLAFRFLV